MIVGRHLSHPPGHLAVPVASEVPFYSRPSSETSYGTQSSGLARLSRQIQRKARPAETLLERNQGLRKDRIPMPRLAQPPADTSVASWGRKEKAQMDIFRLLCLSRRNGQNKEGPG